MTEAQIQFVREFAGCVETFRNYGRMSDPNRVAESILRGAGLFYVDLDHKGLIDNPAINALVNVRDKHTCFTFFNFVLLLEAMQYCLRKKAEEDARINTHDH